MAAPRRISESRPTRRAIVELLEASLEGMTTRELAHALGLHPNGVRKQLSALVADGSIDAEREMSGRRGRPAVRYRAAEEGREAVAARRLGSMLVELVAEIGPDEELVEEFGRRHADRLGARRDGRSALLNQLTTMGFSPRETTGLRSSRSGHLDIVLGNCPFASAVEARGGQLVCALHRGLSRGLVEMTPSARLTAFEIRPPKRAGCRLAAEGLPLPPTVAASDPARPPRGGLR